jgi:hypothetical protein
MAEPARPAVQRCVARGCVESTGGPPAQYGESPRPRTNATDATGAPSPSRLLGELLSRGPPGPPLAPHLLDPASSLLCLRARPHGLLRRCNQPRASCRWRATADDAHLDGRQVRRRRAGCDVDAVSVQPHVLLVRRRLAVAKLWPGQKASRPQPIGAPISCQSSLPRHVRPPHPGPPRVADGPLQLSLDLEVVAT